MTARTDLAAFLRWLCAVPGDAPLVARHGPPSPSERSDEYQRFTIREPAGLVAIDVRPWSPRRFGVVVCTLAEPRRWTRADVDAVCGPLDRGPSRLGEPAEWQGILDDETLPARAVTYAQFDAEGPDATLEALTVRVESMAKYR